MKDKSRSGDEGSGRRRFSLPSNPSRVRGLVERELQFHVEERIEGLMAQGMSRAEAESQVQHLFGDYTRYREEIAGIDTSMIRDQNRRDFAGSLIQSVRLSLRTLLRTPAFTTLVLITLALGIGATAAIYSVVYAVALKQLPYPEPQELVALKHPASVPGSGETKWGLSVAGFHYVETESKALEQLGAFRTYNTTVIENGEASRVPAAAVTSGLVSTLGLNAVLGRSILPSDDVPGAEPVVVAGHSAWVSRYGSDPTLVGRTIEFGGYTARVVGVMRDGAVLPHIDVGATGSTGGAMQRADFWFPMRIDFSQPPVNSHYLYAVGRLAPGATIEQAQSEFSQLTARFPELFPTAYRQAFMRDYGFRSAVTPLRSDVVGTTERMLWLVLAAVGVVFVIAAVNAANLFLVRAEVRRRDTAIRSALGATTRQLGMYHVSEGLLVSLAGGAFGVMLAVFGLKVLLAVAPSQLPRMDEVSVGWQAMVLALTLAVICGTSFGLFPLLSRGNNLIALRDGGRGTTTSRLRRHVRGGLVIGQVALALVLLAAAGLMMRTVMELSAVRPGFDAAGVVAADIPLPSSRYRGYEAVMEFHRALGQRVAAIPGVESTGIGSLPLTEMEGCAVVFAEGITYSSDVVPPCATAVLAGPGYFAALGMQVRGHVPDWSDLDGNSGAVVVTRALAERLWPGQDPIGKGLRPNGPQPPYFRVRGVVEELRGTGLERPPTEVAFYPIRPIPGTMLWQPPNTTTLIVKTTLDDPSILTSSLRTALSEIDPTVPLANVRTMESVVRASTARATFVMTLLSIAAVMAVILSAVGLYGVISYLVTQRRGEIGVRMALGARVQQVSAMIVRESFRLTIPGVIAGIAISLAANRLLGALLFQVKPNDPLILGTVSAGIILVALIASLAPANRAARVDPVNVLREDS